MNTKSGMSRVSLVLVLGAIAVVLVLAAVGYNRFRHAGSAAGPAAATQDDSLEARRARDLAAVERATTAQDLKPYLQGDLEVAKAALQKLARMGDTATISQAFDEAPRRTGTGANGGVKALALEALRMTGKPEARQFIEKTVDRFLQDGPLVQTYSHIYDPQYYAVVQTGLDALGSFDDPTLDAKLEAVAADESRFYSIRETAYGAWLDRQMRHQNVTAPAQRGTWLLARLEPGGVLAEKWWKGADSPGAKTQEAAREATVEDLLLRQGWDARGPLQDCLASDKDDLRRIAAARVLSILVVQHLAAAGQGDPTTEDRKALLSVVDALASLPHDTQASPTIYRLMGVVKTGADALNDADINGRCRAIRPNLKRAGAWSGSAPGQDALGMAVPPDAVFVPEYSTRTETPYGTFVRAGYVTNQPPADVVQFFENATGTKAVARTENGADAAQGKQWVIKFGERPELANFEGIMDLGVIILDLPGGFEDKAFGETVRKAATVFYVSAIK